MRRGGHVHDGSNVGAQLRSGGALLIGEEDVGRSLQVRLIQTSLGDARTISLEDDAAAAAAVLRAENFDQAPVVEEGRIVGVARRDALAAAGTVRDAVRGLSDGLLVSGDTPLGDVPTLLLAEPFLFVLDRARIAGFVTPWDLNKQPARAHLYLLLADLEMSLAALIRRRYGREQGAMLELLDPDRASKIRGRFRKARRQDRESDIAALLDFEDVLEIAGADEYLRRRLGSPMRDDWAAGVAEFSTTRQGVMHLTGELVGGRLSLDELINVERRVRTLATSIRRVRRVARYRPVAEASKSSQVVTATDIAAGRIRLPKPAKALFPPRKGKVVIALRGRSMTVAYDPRLGPDRERSAVLHIGRARLESLSKPGDRLFLSVHGNVIELE